ncbi:hypothetical protein [Synoicihabitans lomoniglobus]|uniref:DUF3667 domain-containing protein n=1 Tax=Synoicihabitans lomoniglobus TaxID=2909285 RepID=A0AAE9ZY70_9BACT|nr:DUF3667 domain-containing protein [Opitutaceae bacterium LMO-M01]WED63343.1 DUF3667 domain-containing protein [Opitutaceae bacterium LMO-M01]
MPRDDAPIPTDPTATDSAHDLPPPPPEEVELTVPHRLRRLGFGLVVDATLGAASFEKGFLYTVKQFVQRPRAGFQGYLGADRLKFSNPLRLLVFVTAVATFFNFQFGSMDSEFAKAAQGDNGTVSPEMRENLLLMNVLLKRYFNVMMLAGVPLLGLASRVLYWKRAYNFVEHMALNAFLMSISTMAYLLTVVLGVWVGKMGLIYGVISLAYQTWVYRRVMGPGWLRAISCTIVGTVLYYIVFAAVLIVFFAVRDGVS